MTRTGKLRPAGRLATLPCAILCLAAVPAEATAAGPALSAHRALYELTLDTGRPASGVAEVTGRMVYEFLGSACSGYSMNMRFVTRVADSDGKSVVTDLRAETWEDGAGDRFTFKSAQYVDSSLQESALGEAKRDEGAAIAIDLDQPADKSFTIDPEALFPTQHLAALIEAAQEGKRLLIRRVYDGSESGEKVYDTTAAIGLASTETRPDQTVARDTQELKDATSWPVTIAYFEQGGGGEQVPSYQLSFNLYPGGVSDGLKLDYGEFALKGTLRQIEFIPEKSCE